MLILRENGSDSNLYYHSVNSSLEISGILASCSTEQETLNLVRKKNLVYALDKIFSYSAEGLIEALAKIDKVSEEDLEDEC